MSALSTKTQEMQLDINELKKLSENATRQKVKDIVSLAARKLETELVELKKELDKEEAAKKCSKPEAAMAELSIKKPVEAHLKDYSWDQSDKFVKIYLTGLNGLDKLPAESIKLVYTEQSVSVKVEKLNGKNFNFVINKTCHKISPDKSYHKAKSDYMLICLAKLNPGSKWSHMTFAEKAIADTKKAEEAPSKDEKEDPSAGLMKMMKKMYDEGDDEMKRTIAKAWTEGQDKRGAGGDMGGMGGMGDMGGMGAMGGLGGMMGGMGGMPDL